MLKQAEPAVEQPLTTPYLDQGTPEQKRQEIHDYFCQTFDQYDHLFEALQGEDAWFKKAISLRHPLIFYYGHTAAFYINKLIAAQLIKKRIDSDIEAMVAIGVDEMSWDDLDENNYNWPSVEAMKEYRQKVRKKIVKFIRKMPLDIPIDWESPAWLILMGIEHERIHLETSSVLMRQLPLDSVSPHPDWPVYSGAGDAPQNSLVKISGKKVQLGKEYNNSLYGWDNEYGRYEVKVDNFKASQYLVSNGEYLEFMNAGGYDTERWWTDEGWPGLPLPKYDTRSSGFQRVKHTATEPCWKRSTCRGTGRLMSIVMRLKPSVAGSQRQPANRYSFPRKLSGIA